LKNRNSNEIRDALTRYILFSFFPSRAQLSSDHTDEVKIIIPGELIQGTSRKHVMIETGLAKSANFSETFNLNMLRALIFATITSGFPKRANFSEPLNLNMLKALTSANHEIWGFLRALSLANH
jgi:hypothetical protein